MEQAYLSQPRPSQEAPKPRQSKRQILPPGYISTQDPTNTFGEFRNLTSTEVQYLRAGNKPYFQMTAQEKLNFRNTGTVPKIGRGNDTPTRTPVLGQAPINQDQQAAINQFYATRVPGPTVDPMKEPYRPPVTRIPPEVLTFNNDQRAFQEKLAKDSDLTSIRNSLEPFQKSLNEKTQKLFSRIQAMNLPKDLLEIFYAGLNMYQARQPETQKLRQIGANYDQAVKSKYGAEIAEFDKRRQELFIKYPPEQLMTPEERQRFEQNQKANQANEAELKRQQELFRKAQERAVSNLTKAPTPIELVQQDPMIVDPIKEPKPSGPKKLTPIQLKQQKDPMIVDPKVDPIRPTLSAPPPPPTFTPDPALEAPKPITPIVPKPKGPIVDPMREPYRPPNVRHSGMGPQGGLPKLEKPGTKKITPIVPKPIQPTVDPMRPTTTAPKRGLMNR